MKRVYIVILVLILAIVSVMVFFPQEPQGYEEGFLYDNETQSGCREICAGVPYKEYCRSSYLSGGPASPCNCGWNGATSQCMSGANLPQSPDQRGVATDQKRITGIYWM